jgi:Acyl-CoA carboxylase epsilon subunit
VSAGEPVLRVVRGEPTAEELAALVVVLTARAAAAAAVSPSEAASPSSWRDRRRVLRAPPTPGSGAWRARAWPV